MANVNFPTSSAQKVASIWHDDTTVADEGKYFASLSPTPGTAIAMTTSIVDDAATASSTHAQYSPFLMIYNTASTANANAPSIFMRYLKLIMGQVPTSASQWRYAWRLDNQNRFTSGGSVLTPVNPNGLYSASSIAQVNCGACVSATGTAAMRLLASGVLDTAIPVTLDTYLFSFGGQRTSNILNGGTTAKVLTLPTPPMVIPPGWCLQLEMWAGSNAAAVSFEVEMGHVERVPGL